VKRFPRTDGESHDRQLVRVAGIEQTGVFQSTTHSDCPENQIRAMVSRVAGVVPLPTGIGLKRLRMTAKLVANHLPKTEANDFAEMPARYTGAKQRRYLKALDEFLSFGITSRDAKIKMFVKAERFDGHAKRNPDPRAIQFRDPKYCVALGAYLHPIEHHIYSFRWASAGVPESRNVAKGLNSVERAELFIHKAAAFVNPRFVCMDASRFDKHVSEELLRIEHSVYLNSNNSVFFQKLLGWQLKNKCYSNLGFVYEVRGRRMSGDMNTAAGNCLLMLIMMICCMRELGITKWDCLDDGDDIVVIVEKDSLEALISGAAKEFLHYGMEMKVELPTQHIHEVVFCQSSIIEFRPERFKFVRDYRLVMSKALSGVRHWEDDNYRVKVLKAIGTCELVLNLGVPVLQAYAVAILRNSGGAARVDLKYAPEYLSLRTNRELKLLGITASDIRPQPITSRARATFAEAFKLGEADQVILEARLDRWTFPVSGLLRYGHEWEEHDWIANQSTYELNRS